MQFEIFSYVWWWRSWDWSVFVKLLDWTQKAGETEPPCGESPALQRCCLKSTWITASRNLIMTVQRICFNLSYILGTLCEAGIQFPHPPPYPGWDTTPSQSTAHIHTPGAISCGQFIYWCVFKRWDENLEKKKSNIHLNMWRIIPREVVRLWGCNVKHCTTSLTHMHLMRCFIPFDIVFGWNLKIRKWIVVDQQQNEKSSLVM